MPAIAAVTLLPRDEDPPKPTHAIAKPKPTTPAADTEDEAPTTKITKVAKVTDDASESMGVKPTAAKTHLSTSAADSASTSGAFQDIKDVADGCVHGVTSEKCKSGPQWVYLSFLSLLVVIVLLIWWYVRRRKRHAKKKKKAQSGTTS